VIASDLESPSTTAAMRAIGSEYHIVGRVVPEPTRGSDTLGTIDSLPDLIEQYHVETLIVGEYLPAHHVREILDLSIASGCELLYPAKAVEIAGVRPTLVWHQNHAFFELGAPVLKAQALMIKRVVDVIGSIVALVVLAPVLGLIAAAIKMDSPGPIIFRQHRAGLGGRRFRMLKFRTMHDGADQEKINLMHLNRTGDIRLFKIENDPRITRLGLFLRRWSLDELPQFWNVLRGDMSLVGPRPFFESDFESYEDHHFRRLDAKPGITGLWQVNGRSEVVDFEEVVRLDRLYIESWSLGLDVRIMFKTLPTVFRRTGAY
jgi:exopolysaccharide biosynthesis polyprenyl glycosylphosphotransferase